MAVATTTGQIAARSEYEEMIEWGLTNGESYFEPLVKGNRRGMFDSNSATFEVPESSAAGMVMNDYAYNSPRPLGNHQKFDIGSQSFSPLVNKAGSLVFPTQQRTFVPASFTPQTAMGEYLATHWTPFLNKHVFSYLVTAAKAASYQVRNATNVNVTNLGTTSYADGDARKIINAVKKKLSKQSASNFGIARNGIVIYCTYDVWENIANDEKIASSNNERAWDEVYIRGEWKMIAGAMVIPTEENYLPTGVKMLAGYRNTIYNPFFIDDLDFTKKPEFDNGTLGQVHILTDVFVLAQMLKAFVVVF